MLNNTTTGTTTAGTTTTGITTGDGISLHAESTGHGTPLLFLHEFAGDHRSWEPQVRYFSARYRCVTYAARGYPPSGVPADPAAYSQERAVADAVAVLDGLGIAAAHVVGLSMGGFAALHLTLRHPDRVLSTVAAGTGYGAAPERQAAFRAECEAIAVAFENEGSEQVARWYAVGPARVQFQNKNPRGWAEFADTLAGHSALGSALTMRGVQAAGRRCTRCATSWPGSPRRCWCWRAMRTRAAWMRRSCSSAPFPPRGWPYCRAPGTPRIWRSRTGSTRRWMSSWLPPSGAPGPPATPAACPPPRPGLPPHDPAPTRPRPHDHGQFLPPGAPF